MSAPQVWSAVQLFQPSPDSVPVIDPALKPYGRLWVPLGCVAPTKALARWQKGGKHQPALCAAYQAGQCPAGEGCANAHVLVPFMTEVRRFLLERPFANCCHEHGDLASKRPDFQALLRRRRVEFCSEAGTIPILPAWLAVTAFFDTAAKEDPASTAVITFDATKVCKLHQSQQCTYGADCRNVHLCRNFWGCVPADHKQVPESAVLPPAETAAPIAAPTPVPVIFRPEPQLSPTTAPAPTVFALPARQSGPMSPLQPAPVSPSVPVCVAPAPRVVVSRPAPTMSPNVFAPVVATTSRSPAAPLPIPTMPVAGLGGYNGPAVTVGPPGLARPGPPPPPPAAA
eukprot:EG_transcript_18505